MLSVHHFRLVSDDNIIQSIVADDDYINNQLYFYGFFFPRLFYNDNRFDYFTIYRRTLHAISVQWDDKFNDCISKRHFFTPLVGTNFPGGV